MAYYRNLTAHQPDALEEILALRPEGADAPAQRPDNLRGRMLGALMGRCAGCVLGVPRRPSRRLRIGAQPTSRITCITKKTCVRRIWRISSARFP